MATWTDQGVALTKDQVEQLIRDACAMLGKCAASAGIKAIIGSSPDNLNFDNPPLAERPNQQKHVLAMLIVHLLNEANVNISPKRFPTDYFDSISSKPLSGAVDVITTWETYPAR